MNSRAGGATCRRVGWADSAGEARSLPDAVSVAQTWSVLQHEAAITLDCGLIRWLCRRRQRPLRWATAARRRRCAPVFPARTTCQQCLSRRENIRLGRRESKEKSDERSEKRRDERRATRAHQCVAKALFIDAIDWLLGVMQASVVLDLLENTPKERWTVALAGMSSVSKHSPCGNHGIHSKSMGLTTSDRG